MPFFSAAFAWFLSWMAIFLLTHPVKPVKILWFNLQGYLISNHVAIAERVGEAVASEISFPNLNNKIVSTGAIEQLLPVIDQHIDYFLRVKLKKSMPVVGMLIGDRTIGQLKEIFIEEVQLLFPSIIENYLSGMQHEVDIKMLVANKIAGIPPEKFTHIFTEAFSREIRSIKLCALLFGFAVGLFQFLLTWVA